MREMTTTVLRSPFFEELNDALGQWPIDLVRLVHQYACNYKLVLRVWVSATLSITKTVLTSGKLVFFSSCDKSTAVHNIQVPLDPTSPWLQHARLEVKVYCCSLDSELCRQPNSPTSALCALAPADFSAQPDDHCVDGFWLCASFQLEPRPDSRVYSAQAEFLVLGCAHFQPVTETAAKRPVLCFRHTQQRTMSSVL
jgi:hypothetical protein